MKYQFTKTIVVALGGSIVHPDDIDTKFLKDFKKFLAPFLKRDIKFVLVVGGGKLARRFQDAAHKISKLTDDDKDWIGIHSTRLNAHLLRTIFRDVADPVIIDNRGKLPKLKYPVTIAAGWRPGWSTDYVAIQIADDFGVPEAVIAGKPSHVYEKDPIRYPSAKKFDGISWKAYRRLVPAKWNPGLHAPVDPIAAALGDKDDVKAIIVDGRDMKNFTALLNGKEFEGTIVG
jgi:uridylate kinase